MPNRHHDTHDARGSSADQAARRARILIRYGIPMPCDVHGADHADAPTVPYVYGNRTTRRVDGANVRGWEDVTVHAPATVYCAGCDEPVQWHDAFTDDYASVDRIVPGAEGGTYEDANVLPMHTGCNRIKRDYLIGTAEEVIARYCERHDLTVPTFPARPRIDKLSREYGVTIDR